MAVTTPTALPKAAQAGLVEFAIRAQTLMHSQYSVRAALENIDKYYQMEGNTGQDDRDARTANKRGDKSRYRDVVVPVVMPQIEAALGYYITVFLSGNPIFAVAGPKEYEEAATQINAIFKNQQRKAKWARQLIMFWRDGLKYNLHGIECDWEQQASYALETEGGSLHGKPKEIIWAGNKFKRMDMYNTFFDPRVAPSEVHELGEFAGYSELYSRIRMKKFINELYGKIPAETAIQAFNSGFAGVAPGTGQTGYYLPQINPESLQGSNPTGQFDWLSWFAGNDGLSTRSGAKINYKNMYQVTKIYARILPSDFGIQVPAENTPQVWKLYVVNNQVLLYAERLTNAHNFIPIVFGQPIEDGLNLQTKSFAQNVMPLQDTSSAFWNAALASKRRLTHDRTYYDPSRIRAADINNPNPAAKIPVRPSAYGKSPADAIHVSPYRDDLSATLVAESEMLQRFANVVNGQNASSQGQFTKGNKTLHEYQDVVGHSNTRNQTLVVMTEEQVHGPLKEIMLLNTLQYPGPSVIPSADGKSTIKVDMAKIRKAMVEFTVSDGLEPVDKEMATEEFTVGLQTMQAVPAIGAKYDVGDMFAYLMKLRGADLSPFEKAPEQVQYEQALGAWQQAAQQAALKGAAFSTPMPASPDQQKIQQQQADAQARRDMSVSQLVQAGPPAADGSQVPGSPGTSSGIAIQQQLNGAK